MVDSDYTDDLRSEVITLLTAVSAEGISEVDTQNLLADLEAQGYSIDTDTLLNLLDGIEIVASASDDKIEIATSDADPIVGQDAQNVQANRVDALASKQATDDVRDEL